MKLFCIPYAGGTTSIYFEWKKLSPQLRARFTDGQQMIVTVPSIKDIFKNWLWYFPNSFYDESTILAGVDSLEGSLNISEGKIFKVAVFQNEHQDIITLCAHQLVMDHFSFRILVEEFFKLLTEYSQKGTISKHLIDNFRENYSFENWINYKQTTYQPTTNDIIKPETNNFNPFLSMDFQEEKIALGKISLPKNIESYLLWTMEQAFYQELQIENRAIILGNNGRIASLMAGKDISKTIGRFGCIAPFAISHDDSVEQIAHNLKKFNDGYGENFLWINDKNVEKHSTITFNWMGDFSKTFNMGLPIQVMNPNALNTLDLYSRENYPFHLKVSSYINGAYLYLSFRYDTRNYSKTAMKATLEFWTKALYQHLKV
ncbi:condensation domain-containing protein [Bombilactobacillus thymidiniphilus]|uniref:Condensation domain-containing protein n=1 Tax=Bombilactobacillus thymidiniphilus TaxID=2923363 RepID=A0ABY4PDU2_9LACO|nr:hypothetical protein [Bombilactobacillus thymidiniphilus]UQS83664.1 hypothetical protein MOO47_00230 [Bombilactobacillus thymidiniphilus]